MIKIPPYLKAGDKIGLICPAGYMPAEKVNVCKETLEQWGYRVQVGATVGSSSENYFSGTDIERLHDLQQMLDDNSIRAIMCARGGYGLGRIIDDVSFRKFRKSPKWIIGFSDITVLHAHLYSRQRFSSLHAPMAAAFNDGESGNEYIQSLRNVLAGNQMVYHASTHAFNRNGGCKGELVGGNLTLLSHLIGTKSELPTKDRILFIEDVGEYLYNIDRMLYQLKRSGKLRKLSGLIVGGFTDCKDTERPFGQTAYEIIRDAVAEYDFPVCYNFPVSHSRENFALKIGIECKLKVGEEGVELVEL